MSHFAGPSPSAAGRSGWRKSAGVVGLFVLVIAVLTGLEHVLSHWLQSAGVGVVGDEPAYLTQAQAVLHGTVHTAGIYRHDLAHHYFSAFPPGTTISPSVFESFRGPRGVVSPFEPGISLLIAPFLGLGGQGGAFVGFYALEAGGLVLVHRRVSGLCRLGWRAQVFLGVALGGPALAVAATQLYPDLLSGIVLAAVLVEVARWERHGQPGWWSVAVIALGCAALPWLQVKNVVPGALVVVAVLVVGLRPLLRSPSPPGGGDGGRRWRALTVVVLVVGVSWALLGAYNVAFFGHLSGYPEPALGFDHAGAVRTLGLLFDRDQGLFVQLPTAVLGLLGVWCSARRTPVTVILAVLAIGAVIALNGAYVGSPYGGVTLAGRFEWTAMPVSVTFGAFALERWQAQGRALLRGAAVVVACWGYQSRSLAHHAHTDLFFSQLSGWDPAVYPGWWSALDHLLPGYVLTPGLLGSPRIGPLVVVTLAVVLVWVPTVRVRSVDVPAGRSGALAAIGLAGLVAVSVALDPGAPLPRGPLTYPGSALGSPLSAATSAARGPLVPLQGTTAGTYRVSVTYTLTGPGLARLTVACDATPTGGTVLLSGHATLPAGDRTVAVTVTCARPGAVAAALATAAGTHLGVSQVRLAKTAAAS